MDRGATTGSLNWALLFKGSGPVQPGRNVLWCLRKLRTDSKTLGTGCFWINVAGGTTSNAISNCADARNPCEFRCMLNWHCWLKATTCADVSRASPKSYVFQGSHSPPTLVEFSSMARVGGSGFSWCFWTFFLSRHCRLQAGATG